MINLKILLFSDIHQEQMKKEGHKNNHVQINSF